MARIRKRGDKFTAEVRYKGISDSQSFAVKRDAERWAAAVERDIDKGIHVPRSEQKRIATEQKANAVPTLANLLESYLDSPEHQSKKGKEQEARRILWLIRQPLTSKSADAVTIDDIETHIEDRQDGGTANNTIRLELATISSVYQFFRKRYKLANPMRDVKRPPPGKSRDRRLQDGEEQRLLTAADGDERPFMRQAIVLALETAMRRGELAGLTWNRVNIGARTILLDITKNGTARTVPLSTRAMAALESLPRQINGLVLGYDGERLSNAFARIRVKAECSDLRWHDLRHEATSRLFENTDLRDIEIMSITGHSSPQMLARYAHLKAGNLVARLG